MDTPIIVRVSSERHLQMNPIFNIGCARLPEIEKKPLAVYIRGFAFKPDDFYF